ncbi:hypothetical protein BKA70DRAFT_1268817, partial [Coprinopsis sp. MPI-PUGE-AT-0042]
TVVVTSGSSTFTVATSIPDSRSTVEVTSLDKDGRPVITKVIPDRVYTTTDSTGGIAVRTEYVEVGASKSTGPSTGLLVGVIVAVLSLFLCVTGVGLLFWRRKKRRRHAEMAETGSFGTNLVREAYTSGSNPFSPPGTPQHGRDVSTTHISADLTPEEAPPAYRMSQGFTAPVAIGKEQANRLRS